MLRGSRISCRTHAFPRGVNGPDTEQLPDAYPPQRKAPANSRPRSTTLPHKAPSPLLRLPDCVMYRIFSKVAEGPLGVQRLAMMERVCQRFQRGALAVVWGELSVKEFGAVGGAGSSLGNGLAAQKSWYRRQLACRRELGDALLGRDTGIQAEDLILVVEASIVDADAMSPLEGLAPPTIRVHEQLQIHDEEELADFNFDFGMQVNVPPSRHLPPASSALEVGLHCKLDVTYRVYVCDQQSSRGGEPRVANILSDMPSEVGRGACDHDGDGVFVDVTSFRHTNVCASSMANKCCTGVHSSAEVALVYSVEESTEEHTAVTIEWLNINFFLGCRGGKRAMTKREFLEGIEHSRWH